MFILITALVSDSVHPMLILTVVAAGLALYLYFRFRWQSLMVFTIILAYLAIFLWLFGNPIMGNTFAIIKQHNGAHVYFLLTGAIFSLLPLLRNENGSDDDFIITAVVIHGLLFTMMLLPFTLGFFRDSYVYLYILLSASCLGYSIFLRYASSWIFPSAFFALYGFMALSIALYGLTGFPVVYLLLAVQSLIVVSMALWFRNRLMIILNTLLFVFIYVLYMISSKPVDGVNFAFAAASLVSARIINWKRERLNIKTELIRNTYLICGFIMVLFALFKAVPGQFVSLSWTLAALSYFLLSFVLRNVKYRYMALGTLISAAIYLFIVDLARIELIYRVLALLSFAIVSIGISIYYSNRSGKNEKAENKI
jgi:uncharacterized membrane protein